MFVIKRVVLYDCDMATILNITWPKDNTSWKTHVAKAYIPNNKMPHSTFLPYQQCLAKGLYFGFCMSLLSVDKVCHCGLKKTWQAVGLDPGDGHRRTKNNPPTARKNMHCFCSQPNGKSDERWLSSCWCLACQVEKVSNGSMWPVGKACIVGMVGKVGKECKVRKMGMVDMVDTVGMAGRNCLVGVKERLLCPP